ncbi:tripartite tricarboxylate transporter substrate binding protein [Pusillimonas sp. TS35]|nr:tripartite tricarboxylate transporter substrate binding protein [Pusillimonas sp. TS35]
MHCFNRHYFGKLLAPVLGGLLALGCTPAHAWPDQPIRIIVPFSAGGTTDLLGRLLAEGISGELGQSVVVENKGGAGGNIGATEVARAKPDGYTLMMGTPGPLAINPLVYKDIAFAPERDFAPVAYIADVANVILSNPKTGFKTVGDLLAAAKAAPDALNWGSPGVGSTGHLMLEMLKQKTGAKITHIPYKGASQAANDLLSGQIQLSGDNLPTALAMINSGKLVALGVTSAKPSAAAPEICAVAETVPGYALTSWFVLMAPAGTPEAVISKLNEAVNHWLAQPASRERLQRLAAQPVGGTPADLGKHLTAERAKYRALIEAAGIGTR